MMFQVEDAEGQLLLIAQESVLAQILGLLPGAVRRLEVETVNGKVCDLHSDPPFFQKWKQLNIKRLPLEIPEIGETLNAATEFVRCHSEDWYTPGQELIQRCEKALSSPIFLRRQAE